MWHLRLEVQGLPISSVQNSAFSLPGAGRKPSRNDIAILNPKP